MTIYVAANLKVHVNQIISATPACHPFLLHSAFRKEIKQTTPLLGGVEQTDNNNGATNYLVPTYRAPSLSLLKSWQRLPCFKKLQFTNPHIPLHAPSGNFRFFATKLFTQIVVMTSCLGFQFIRTERKTPQKSQTHLIVPALAMEILLFLILKRFKADKGKSKTSTIPLEPNQS